MPREVIDDAGVRVRLARPPGRIVSLVPSLTELLCDLGAAARLVGVTRFCTDPPEVVAPLPKLGGTKNPDCDAILALAPDLILVNSEENRRVDYERLAASDVPVFVSFPTTVAAAAESIRRIGVALGCEAPANALAGHIDAAREATPAGTRKRVRVFCPIWRNPWMTFNRDTFAGDVLDCAGGENVAADAADRYPRVVLREIASRDPEMVLLPDEPYRFETRHVDALCELSDTAAWRGQRIHLIDGKAISWYGRRTPGAIFEIAALLREP